jgi:hypothetical protein
LHSGAARKTEIENLHGPAHVGGLVAPFEMARGIDDFQPAFAFGFDKIVG